MTFSNSSRRRGDDDFQAAQETEIDFLQASPSTTLDEHLQLPSPSRENRTPPPSSADSDVELIGRSISSQSTPKSETERRATEKQPTSRLILDVIPHEIADEVLRSAQNMGTLPLLEAKAEETIDLLLRNWTYVDPEYFSEDDRSSTTSTEPSLSFSRRHTHKGKSPILAEKPSSPNKDSIREGSSSVGTSGLTEELFVTQGVSMDGESSSSIPAGHTTPARNGPSEASPISRGTQGNRESSIRRSSHEQNNQAVQNPKEPSTPAPPYSSGEPRQCPSCSAASDTESKTHGEKRLWRSIGGQIGDPDIGEGTNTSIDAAVKLFETRLLDLIKGVSLLNVKQDTQLHPVPERKEDPQQPIVLEQDAEPVILRDCFGREFLFPIQKCKSWQVSPPTKVSHPLKADLGIDP